jgi:putative holliday junction resolvase
MSEIGRHAGVDYGRRRIGLAVSDALGITVRGLDTVVLREGDDPVAAAARVLSGERVVRLVVGLPLHADGRESDMSREARGFGDALGTALGVPVAYVDEGLTSWEAEEGFKARRKPLEKARKEGAIDRAVAVGLLRGWLRDREAGTGAG